MYAAGLTVREIADRVGWARSTVQRHLQVRESHLPGLRATHEAARAKRPPGWQRHAKQEQQRADDDTRAGAGSG
ncbi:helix-turn-helix domain-containing protein [Arthrobacter sp. Sr24]